MWGHHYGDVIPDNLMGTCEVLAGSPHTARFLFSLPVPQVFVLRNSADVGHHSTEGVFWPGWRTGVSSHIWGPAAGWA